MQHIDRPRYIQPLPEPGRTPRPRVDTKALRVVRFVESLDGIRWDRGRWRHFGQGAAIWPPELEGAVGPARDLVALLVHCPVMPPTEQGKVRERRRPTVRPVAEMMPLGEAQSAPREAAALVPMVEGTA